MLRLVIVNVTIYPTFQRSITCLFWLEFQLGSFLDTTWLATNRYVFWEAPELTLTLWKEEAAEKCHLYKIVHGFFECTTNACLALNTSQDTHILSHSYNLRLPQTPFSLAYCSNLEPFTILSCHITYEACEISTFKNVLYNSNLPL